MSCFKNYLIGGTHEISRAFFFQSHALREKKPGERSLSRIKHVRNQVLYSELVMYEDCTSQGAKSKGMGHTFLYKQHLKTISFQDTATKSNHVGSE